MSYLMLKFSNILVFQCDEVFCSRYISDAVFGHSERKALSCGICLAFVFRMPWTIATQLTPLALIDQATTGSD